MSFIQDLKFGENYQKKLLELIEYDTYEIAEGCFKPWDVKIKYKDDIITFEVKADRMANETGNIAIEYECSGKPSGITTTEADYWVYFIDKTNKYFLIPTSDIHKAIENNKYSRKVRGGDNYRTAMYLFSIPVFQEFCETY